MGTCKWMSGITRFLKNWKWRICLRLLLQPIGTTPVTPIRNERNLSEIAHSYAILEVLQWAGLEPMVVHGMKKHAIDAKVQN